MRDRVVKIRRATVADAERVSALLREVALQFIVDEFDGLGRARYLQQLAPKATAKRLAGKDFRCLVAEDSSAMVGVVALQGNWHLYHLVVAKEYQRGGLARRLWQLLRDEVLGADPPRNFKANVPRYAIGAYMRLGFKADGPTRKEKGAHFQPMTCPVLLEAPQGK